MKCIAKVRNLALLTLAVVSLAAGEVFAGVTIPDAGVEVAGYITAAITALGSVVAVAVGGFFAFLIVRKALRWGRTIG